MPPLALAVRGGKCMWQLLSAHYIFVCSGKNLQESKVSSESSSGH